MPFSFPIYRSLLPASGVRNPRPRGKSCAVRAAGFLALLSLVVFLCGCSWFAGKRESRGVLEIAATAVGKAPAEEEWTELLGLRDAISSESLELAPAPEEAAVRTPGKDFPRWASETLRTQAEIPFAEGANSHVQALMLARREARDQILNDLAERIAAFPSPRGGTVLDEIGGRENLRVELENALRSSIEFSAEEDAGSAYRVSASLPLRPIALVLFGEVRKGGRTAPKPSAATVQRSAVAISKADSRRIARERALQEARFLLLEKVRSTLLSEGYTLGDQMDRDPNAATYVRMAVEHALEERVEYPDNQTCEITLSLDLEPVLRRLWDRHGY